MKKKRKKERGQSPVETGHDHRSSEKDNDSPKAPDGVSGYF